MSTEVRQKTNHRHARTQKRRSPSSRRGRGLRRCRTSSCCRRQRLSAISNAFGRTAAAIAHSKQRNIDRWDRNRARLAVGEGLPFPLFRLQDGVTFSPWRTVPEAPLKSWTVGFPEPSSKPWHVLRGPSHGLGEV